VTAAAILVALLSALLFAVGSVMQQREAAEVPDEDSLGVGLLTRLIRRPVWLIGTAGDTLGYVAQAVALWLGALVIVQPLLATYLLFALPLGAWWAGRRLRRADAAWALALTAGLAVFLVAGNPTTGVDQAPFHDWLPVLVVVVPLAAVCIVVARRSLGTVRAVALASATGILYGLGAALTKSSVDLLADGLVPVLTSWEPYALAAAIGLGTFLQQSSYQAGDLSQALPAAAVLEPVVGVAIGIAVLQERIQADGAEWVLIAAASLTMILATAALARLQARGAPAESGERSGGAVP
jgi:drug/metabolite transporter (DMT)-like permease